MSCEMFWVSKKLFWMLDLGILTLDLAV